MAYINVIEHEEAEGRLREIYDGLVQSRGKLASVHKIQSLNPETIVQHMELYMGIMFGRSPLRRYQREMIAVVVSTTNACEYCTVHHGDALLHFWKDEARLQALIQNPELAGLEAADLALCAYAKALTQAPGAITEAAHVEPLRSCGLEDRAILDAALVISYFNFVNRMVMGLGVHLEPEGGKGYDYA